MGRDTWKRKEIFWYHHWNHCRPCLPWGRVFMDMSCDIRSHQKAEVEVCTPVLQDHLCTIYSPAAIPFSNLNLDKSGKENKIFIFEVWADPQAFYMTSFWQIWTLKLYFFSHCCNWMGTFTLKTLAFNSFSLFFKLVNLLESGISAVRWVFVPLPVSPLNIFRINTCNRKVCTAPGTWPMSLSIHN